MPSLLAPPIDSLLRWEPVLCIGFTVSALIDLVTGRNSPTSWLGADRRSWGWRGGRRPDHERPWWLEKRCVHGVLAGGQLLGLFRDTAQERLADLDSHHVFDGPTGALTVSSSNEAILQAKVVGAAGTRPWPARIAWCDEARFPPSSVGSSGRFCTGGCHEI